MEIFTVFSTNIWPLPRPKLAKTSGFCSFFLQKSGWMVTLQIAFRNPKIYALSAELPRILGILLGMLK